MKSHCVLCVLGNKSYCTEYVNFMFIGLREAELLMANFIVSFLLLSQGTAKLWCRNKQTNKHDIHDFSS